MPDVVWPIGHHDEIGGLSVPIGARAMLFFEDSSNGRCAQVKSRAAKGVGDSHLPHGGTKGFKAPHDMADKVGNLLTGSGSCKREFGPFSSSRRIHEETVA